VHPPRDFKGQRIGRLKVLEWAGKYHRGGNYRWKCVCDCGNVVVVLGGNLTRAIRTGEPMSCGCLSRELSSIRNATHGCARHGRETSEYGIWHGMLQRCYNPRTSSYKSYGARGIRVCERWRRCFENFLADMGPRPSRLHSIDRLDPNGDYEPGNCRWATWKEQQNHRRTTRILEWNGQRHSATEWAEITGLRPRLILNRIDAGWDVERALTAPVRRQRNNALQEGYDGRTTASTTDRDGGGHTT